MITAKVTIEREWNNRKVEKDEVEFYTIAELESYLAYNRAYILKIRFVGAIKVERY